MLKKIGASSLEDLTKKALPDSIRLDELVTLPDDNQIRGEGDVLTELREILNKNKARFFFFIFTINFNFFIKSFIKHILEWDTTTQNFLVLF